MLDDRTAHLLAATPQTPHRLEAAEYQRVRLAALLDEVRSLRTLVPEGKPASWQSPAADAYDGRLANVRGYFAAGCDELERAHDGLSSRIDGMRRSLDARAARA